MAAQPRQSGDDLQNALSAQILRCSPAGVIIRPHVGGKSIPVVQLPPLPPAPYACCHGDEVVDEESQLDIPQQPAKRVRCVVGGKAPRKSLPCPLMDDEDEEEDGEDLEEEEERPYVGGKAPRKSFPTSAVATIEEEDDEELDERPYTGGKAPRKSVPVYAAAAAAATTVTGNDQNPSSRKKRSRSSRHHSHHSKKSHEKKRHHKHQKKRQRQASDSEGEDSTGSASSSSSSSSSQGEESSEDANSKKAKRRRHEANRIELASIRERDKVCANPHPLYVLLAAQMKPRPCGKCKGCDGCGDCENCRRNIKANEEYDRAFAEFILKNPEYADQKEPIPAACDGIQDEEAKPAKKPQTRAKKLVKISGRPQRSKRLICQRLQCERLSGTPWENSPASIPRQRWTQLNVESRELKAEVQALELEIKSTGDAVYNGTRQAALTAKLARIAEIKSFVNKRRRKNPFQTGFSFLMCSISKNEKMRIRHAKDIIRHNEDTEPKSTQDIRRRTRDMLGGVINGIVQRFIDVIDIPAIHEKLEDAIARSRAFTS